MAVIIKNPVAFRCNTFAKRYPSHEAAMLLEEAAALIEQLDEELADYHLAQQAEAEK